MRTSSWSIRQFAARMLLRTSAETAIGSSWMRRSKACVLMRRRSRWRSSMAWSSAPASRTVRRCCAAKARASASRAGGREANPTCRVRRCRSARDRRFPRAGSFPHGRRRLGDHSHGAGRHLMMSRRHRCRVAPPGFGIQRQAGSWGRPRAMADPADRRDDRGPVLVPVKFSGPAAAPCPARWPGSCVRRRLRRPAHGAGQGERDGRGRSLNPDRGGCRGPRSAGGD